MVQGPLAPEEEEEEEERAVVQGPLGTVTMRPVHSGGPLWRTHRLAPLGSTCFRLPPPPLPVMNFVTSGAVQLRRVNGHSALPALSMGGGRMGARAAGLLATCGRLRINR